MCDDMKLKEELLKLGEEPGQLNLDTIFTQCQKYEQRMQNLKKPTHDVTERLANPQRSFPARIQKTGKLCPRQTLPLSLPSLRMLTKWRYQKRKWSTLHRYSTTMYAAP